MQKWKKGEGKKIREISNRTDPGASGNNARPSNFRQSNSFRRNAPDVSSPRGQDPANIGVKSGAYHSGTFARPSINPGAHGNIPRPPGQFAGCFNCGDLTHFMRNCPALPVERQGPQPVQQYQAQQFQPPPQPPQPLAPQSQQP